jgi:hypothetical protein
VPFSCFLGLLKVLSSLSFNAGIDVFENSFIHHISVIAEATWSVTLTDGIGPATFGIGISLPVGSYEIDFNFLPTVGSATTYSSKPPDWCWGTRVARSRRDGGGERLVSDLNGANLRVVWGKITLDFPRVGLIFAH